MVCKILITSNKYLLGTMLSFEDICVFLCGDIICASCGYILLSRGDIFCYHIRTHFRLTWIYMLSCEDILCYHVETYLYVTWIKFVCDRGNYF